MKIIHFKCKNLEDLRKFCRKAVFISDDDFIWYRYYEEPLIRGGKIQKQVSVLERGVNNFNFLHASYLSYHLKVENIGGLLHVTLTKI